MDRYPRNPSIFLTRLVYGLGMKHRPTPAPQTSLILELPDELILSILSYISPEPLFADHYVRLRLQYGMVANDRHLMRMRFLLSLSMTCRAMRFRLLPWIWGRLECPEVTSKKLSKGHIPRKLDAIVNVLRADTFLATSVRFMTVYLVYKSSAFPEFVKCLKSLPNLHTLEIGQMDYYPKGSLENELGRVKLPQIKTLILPPHAFPLLRSCRNVEDVVYVLVGSGIEFVKEFWESLASIQDSKVKCLTIPMISRENISRYVAAVPRLTELTLLCSRPADTTTKGTWIPPDLEATKSATTELVDTCKALPDFDTLQIVHLPRPVEWWSGDISAEQRDKAWTEQLKGLKDLVINRLGEPRTRYQERRVRKRTMLKIIELSADRSRAGSHLDSLTVEEYEV